MLVYVMPGETPPTPLVLINELNALRFRTSITAVRVRRGDQSENSKVAQEWAEMRGIPVTNGGLPHAIVLTVDLTDADNVPNFIQDEWNVWKEARREDPEGGILKHLRYLVQNKRTIWVNTGQASYKRMMERREAIGDPSPGEKTESKEGAQT